jgi:RecB family exonuclease
LLDDERRLFYVAATRARRRLLVTAVLGGEAEEQPSRFLAELAGRHPGDAGADGDGDGPVVGARLPRALTLPALVAELRTVVADEGAAAGRRRAAARQLARLAAAGVPGAHPETWWGLPELSDGRSLAGPGETVEVSPSTVEQVRRCGVRWVLERHGGANPPTPEQNVGTLVHAAAAESGDLDELRRYLDEHWDEVEFPARWLVGRRRHEADEMLDRLAGWLSGNPRKLVATEHRFRTRLPDLPGEPAVELTGAVDRLELDDAGRPVIVDLKTGRTAPTDDAAAVHPQLAAYQVAAAHDAFADQPGVAPGAEPGGAALVQLGLSRRGAREQRQPALSDADNPAWAEDMVHDAARAMAANTFVAVVNDHCRMCAVRTSCPLNAKGRQVTE